PIYVCEAVAISDHESLLFKMRAQAAKAAACQRVHAGVDQPNLPVGCRAPGNFAGAIFQIDEEIAVVHDIVVEVLLDDLALVAASHEKIVEAMRGVEAHEVPEHGLAADLTHAYGAACG